jgi:hypothetical protein
MVAPIWFVVGAVVAGGAMLLEWLQYYKDDSMIAGRARPNSDLRRLKNEHYFLDAFLGGYSQPQYFPPGDSDKTGAWNYLGNGLWYFEHYNNVDVFLLHGIEIVPVGTVGPQNPDAPGGWPDNESGPEDYRPPDGDDNRPSNSDKVPDSSPAEPPPPPPPPQGGPIVPPISFGGDTDDAAIIDIAIHQGYAQIY